MKFALLALPLLFGQANASPELIDTFGDWQAYKAEGVCFAACQPTKSEGKYGKRGDVFLLVSHRPDENIKGEFSTLLGYTLDENAKPQLLIDGKATPLVAQEEAGFVKDDKKVVAALKKGSTVVVKATSARGTKTVDTYSLKGFSRAYDAAEKACRE